MNKRLEAAIADGAAATTYYEKRVLEILGKLRPGATITRATLYRRLGLAPVPVGQPAREATGHETGWCERVLDALEHRGLLVVPRRGNTSVDDAVRLVTDKDRARKAAEEREEARLQEIGRALGRNTAYETAHWEDTHVVFAGPAVKKLEALLVREGLLPEEQS